MWLTTENGYFVLNGGLDPFMEREASVEVGFNEIPPSTRL